MRIKDTFKLSVSELRHSKLRTWLTITGIIIGIAAMVSIVSIGEGLQAAVSSNLQGLGADIITIQPGFNRAAGFGFRGGGPMQMMPGESNRGNLTAKDLSLIKSVPNVKYVTGVVSGRLGVSFSGESISVSVQGVDTSIWRFITNTELESGRHLSSGDANTVVIGSRVANTMFKKQISLSSQIVVGGRPFKVIGILKETGSFRGDDSTIFMPIQDARNILSKNDDQFSSIQIKVAYTSLVAETINNTDRRLMLSRHVKEDTKDFTVISPLSIQETVSQITSSITFFLGGIASISLLVGAIGISNTMYMSVTERRRQIGILKALGSTNREILKIFLIESALLGLVGGLIGSAVGSLVSFSISGIVGAGFPSPGVRGTGGIATVINPSLLLFAIGFSVFIGIVSGIFPARQASRLQPIDVLRSE